MTDRPRRERVNVLKAFRRSRKGRHASEAVAPMARPPSTPSSTQYRWWDDDSTVPVDGDIRYVDGENYRLTREQVIAYRRARFGDELGIGGRWDTEANAIFSEWWKAFVEKHKLTPEPRTQIQTFGTSYGSGSYSSYYTGWGHGWSAGSTTNARLAMALQAVRTVVRVIDAENSTPMEVLFAGSPATDFNANKVTISPRPMLERKIADDEAVDILTGEGLHEGSHARWGKTAHAEQQRDKREPRSVLWWLANLLEDARTEGLLLGEYPGFRGYLTKLKQYVFDSFDGKLPEYYGPDLESKLEFVVLSTLYREQFAGHLSTMPGATEVAETAWWRDFLQRYIDAKMTLADGVWEGLAHLGLSVEEPPNCSISWKANQAAEDIEQLKQRDRTSEANSESLAKQLTKAPVCLTDALRDQGNDRLTEDQGRQVGQLVTEELSKDVVPVWGHEGTTKPVLSISKPAETPVSKQYGNQPLDSILSRLKSAIVLREARPLLNSRLLKEGDVDDDELWRWATDDYRVFHQEIIEAAPSARIYLLVDCSGSMSGGKLVMAQRVARLFVEAFTSMSNVATKVFGHTTGATLLDTAADIYRIWEPGDPKSRVGTVMTVPHGGNYDGYAIAWVVEQILKDSRDSVDGEDEQKILIVLSDGQPNGAGYGAWSAVNHVRHVVDYAAKHGVRVLQIAVDVALNDDVQKQMFKEYIPCKIGDPLSALPARIAAWLRKNMET